MNNDDDKGAPLSGSKTAVDPVEHIKQYQFKKGQSGNPKGRPRLPPELRQIKEISNQEVKRILAKYSRMTVGDLKELTKKDELNNIPAMEAVVIKIILKSLAKGDYYGLNFIYDRTIGKVPNTATVITDSEEKKAFDLAYVLQQRDND